MDEVLKSKCYIDMDALRLKQMRDHEQRRMEAYERAYKESPLDKLEAENKALRTAIARFPEFATMAYYGDEIIECPYCGGSNWAGHDPQCIRNLIPGRGENANQDELPDLSALGLRPTAPEPEEPPQSGSVKFPNGLTLSWHVIKPKEEV